jgi:hypothetical protein
MLSYKLSYPTDKELLPINTQKKYASKSLISIKNLLAINKSQLDKNFSDKYFPKYWREFDPFKQEKTMIAKLGNTYNVSNAWLKCYEILISFNLIPQTITQDEFIHFDNASFPGSFIVSTHHYIKTHRDWHLKYKWYGSSLIEANDLNADPIEDKYGLYKNYPDKWMMDENNNGDVLIKENQKKIKESLGGKVDLYTSDLGFDVSSDYNNQEILQSSANIGQILSGILTLKKGGCFITKQYTTFEMNTVSVMFAVSSFFDEFYICKPTTSKEANSETYLVGKGFKGDVSFDHPYIQAMFDRIDGTIKLDIPLFDAKSYPKKYLNDIVKASEIIFNRQIEKINIDIERVYKCINQKYSGNPKNHPVILEFRKNIEPKVKDWYKQMQILPINRSLSLKMIDAFRQDW